MPGNPPTEPAKRSGIHVGDVGGNVNFSALGDIVGGDKVTNFTTTIQISVEAVTQRPLNATSPYRGLERFEDRDKDLFFGRDQLIKSLLGQLGTSNVLLVLGASGSGKSSVVRAGLLPQLSQIIGARFRYFTFVPDVNPFESFRCALVGAGFSQAQTRELFDADPATPARLIRKFRREGEQWLFFVDQFEEMFTVCEEASRQAFIAALLAIVRDADSPAKLVLAMRADFLDRFSPFPEFAKVIEKDISLVADMFDDELRQAIEQPAARHGVVFEQGLVEEIIKDVQGQAGSLPLLQYTLDLLWQEEVHKDGLADRHLNTQAYRTLGGVRGALQKRANEIYASFGDGTGAKAASPRQEIVRQIFLRLVDLAGEDSSAAAWRPVRRRTPMATFTAPQEQEILQAIIDQKLLVSNREGDAATVEVAHEALFASWERLKNWIQAGKQVIFAKNRLADDAGRWQRRQQEGDAAAEEELLAGSRLSQALDMRARGDFTTVVGGLGKTETQFLDASAARRDRRAEEERARQQRELEAANHLAEAQTLAAARLRKGLVAAIVLLLAAIGIAIYAGRQKQEALEKSRQANVAKKAADDRTKEAFDLISFMDAQIGQAFVDVVPVQLRERVSARVEAFYTPEKLALAGFDEHQLMGYHIREALVHLAAGHRYQDADFDPELKKTYVAWEQESASKALHEALRIGESVARKSPDHRGVTRDRILSHFHLATLSTELKDAPAAREQLRAARELLEAMVRGGPFSEAQLTDWMGLPNLDASMGDLAAGQGDNQEARQWYLKAMDGQRQLCDRRPTDEAKMAELQRTAVAMGDLAANEGNKEGPDGARVWYLRALDLAAQRFPGVPAHPRRMAVLQHLCAAMGELEWDLGHKDASLAWYKNAVDLQTNLVTRHPEDEKYRTELQRVQKRLAEISR